MDDFFFCKIQKGITETSCEDFGLSKGWNFRFPIDIFVKQSRILKNLFSPNNFLLRMRCASAVSAYILRWRAYHSYKDSFWFSLKVYSRKKNCLFLAVILLQQHLFKYNSSTVYNFSGRNKLRNYFFIKEFLISHFPF